MTNFFMNYFRWQNFTHYFLITFGLFWWIKLFDFIASRLINKLNIFMRITSFNILLLVWMYIGLLFLDTFIELGFWVAPRPIRWRK